MKSFWQDLPKPIYALAPMEGVTDTVFRRIVAYCGKPTVFFTEFTNVDGLFSKGKKEVEHRLQFTPVEKPLIAQIWGMEPDNYTRAAELAVEMGFDGIDINMGCPERNVVKRGACAGLINNPEHAGKIIEAAKKGAGKLPVSVKTRIGVKEIVTESWISFLLEQNISALTVHLRTAREMSNPPPHWEELPKVVELRNKINPETVLLANGNIESLEEANAKVKEFGIDGVMVGRGIFKDPFLFDGKTKLDNMALSERLDLLLKHATLFEETWGQSKHFAILKKFFKIYTLGLPNASEIRERLMTTENLEDVRGIIKTLTN
ncbi:MAG TPA: tRNA-dihydrouridine synthase [Patescibacteria group bacterium]|nr:tRNA-dihydrouridine synthase [Patescibacteria group bacterium]